MTLRRELPWMYEQGHFNPNALDGYVLPRLREAAAESVEGADSLAEIVEGWLIEHRRGL